MNPLNLLTDPLIRIKTTEREARVNLPELLELLGQDAVESYDGLQPHQEEPLHVFLCYLASVVLYRHGLTSPTQSAAFWREALRHLTREWGDAPWCLVVDDLSKPAFLQPPVDPQDQPKLSVKATTPDEMDVLVTARDHDIKMRRIVEPNPDHWVYALLTLQTTSGYSGNGLYGISRMNSGSGSRIFVEFADSLRHGPRWSQAVQRLLAGRQSLIESGFGYQDNGIVLTWLMPWDGTTALTLSELDPFYIEICRRIRLRYKEESIVAESLTSKGPRIHAKELSGNVGDPWTPLDLESTTPKAFTPSAKGLDANVLRRLVFRDQMQLSFLQDPSSSQSGSSWLVASVLVRGQGKTEGFRQVYLHVPAHVRRVLGRKSDDYFDKLASVAKIGIDYAGKMEIVLKRAVFAFLEASDSDIKLDNDTFSHWWLKVSTNYHERWQIEYFPWLWHAIDANIDGAPTRWAKMLVNYAKTVLVEAEKSLPCKTSRQWKAIIAANQTFDRMLSSPRYFPFLREENHVSQ
ncbi:type I-E CRISPR-associated protein Cse1/CasA [Sulfobacillus thermosulfidooxidans]|uniref:type I-E CRISPR-associated protein Cse1/CasA n=1 Tax=Sulfobacillus thermosulfidooxidans TaxID=28034 RepID=UPI0002FDCB10|nr:type I-E CRISPR-associated protein Cse1/CasA [Sulfobacillus thermosulfidooxidans]